MAALGAPLTFPPPEWGDGKLGAGKQVSRLSRWKSLEDRAECCAGRVSGAEHPGAGRELRTPVSRGR